MKQVLAGQGRGWLASPFLPVGCIDPDGLTAEIIGEMPELAAATHRVKRAVLEELYQQLGPKCSHCGGRQELQVDHIIPREWGGSDWEGNCRVRCKSCNSSRQARFCCSDPSGWDRIHRVVVLELKAGA